jgi:hypothetical protein
VVRCRSEANAEAGGQIEPVRFPCAHRGSGVGNRRCHSRPGIGRTARHRHPHGAFSHFTTYLAQSTGGSNQTALLSRGYVPAGLGRCSPLFQPQRLSQNGVERCTHGNSGCLPHCRRESDLSSRLDPVRKTLLGSRAADGSGLLEKHQELHRERLARRHCGDALVVQSRGAVLRQHSASGLGEGAKDADDSIGFGGRRLAVC